MAERVKAKGLDMALIFDSNIPTKLCGDPSRLHQILTNLVGNAVKFTDRGKVTIKVSKQDEKDDRLMIRFDVKDTGIGISEIEQKKLFSPFVQADGSMTRRYGGTGLGLVIAKQLVEMMGGTIGYTSDPDHGSIFSFTASLTKQDPKLNVESDDVESTDRRSGRERRSRVKLPTPPRATPTPVNRSGWNETNASPRRVLLVEDNEVNQMVAGDQLTRRGYSVEIASNGQEALDALALASYDLVLMDCGMPVMDGYTAAAEIRKREGTTRHTPIVAMTAHAMNGDSEKCLAAGMDAYLAKPVKGKALEKILNLMLGQTNFSDAGSVSMMLPATPVADESSPVDLEILTSIASTPARLRKIIEMYLQHTDGRLEALKAAVTQGSSESVYAIAHKCLGGSLTLGMTAIVPALKELQRMGRADDLNGAADQCGATSIAFGKLKSFLEIYLEQLPA